MRTSGIGSQRARKLAMGVSLACCASLLCAQFAAAQGVPAASEVASPKVYVSVAPVPRSSTFEVAVVVGIMPGFHMNAHMPSEEYLIPTVLTAKLPAGFREGETIYPAGIEKKLSFADKPLLVYTNRFTIRTKISAAANAPLGKVKLPFALQYQACNDSVCLPPVRIPVVAAIDVAPAGAKPQQLSPQIFGQSVQR
jgi:thioredoxin:protein disulfide reductase